MTETPSGQPPSGLDRIEAILFTMATNLSQVATNQLETDFRLNQVSDKLDRTADQFRELVIQQVATDARLDRVIAQQEATDARLDRLTTAISDLTVETDSLRDIVMHFVQLSERDREQAAADRQQAVQDRQAWQAETRRIWEYLRDRNGGSSTPN